MRRTRERPIAGKTSQPKWGRLLTAKTLFGGRNSSDNSDHRSKAAVTARCGFIRTRAATSAEFGPPHCCSGAVAGEWWCPRGVGVLSRSCPWHGGEGLRAPGPRQPEWHHKSHTGAKHVIPASTATTKLPRNRRTGTQNLQFSRYFLC